MIIMVELVPKMTMAEKGGWMGVGDGGYGEGVRNTNKALGSPSPASRKVLELR